LQCGFDLHPVGAACVGASGGLRQVRCHSEKNRRHDTPPGVAVWCGIRDQLSQWEGGADKSGFLYEFAVSGVLQAFSRTDESAREREHAPEGIRAAPYE